MGEQNLPYHANYAETSGVLAIRPDLVHMERAENENRVYVWEYKMSDISKSGVGGTRVTEANKAEGVALIEEAVEFVVTVVQKGLREKHPAKT